MCTPGKWPCIESAAEKENDYLCETFERAVRRGLHREISRSHEYKTYAQLKALLRRYGLPSNGRQGVLLARLTAYEATLTSPPFIAVTGLLPFPFLKLPNEIRNMVYKELLTLKGTPRSRVVNILRAKKQIYNEAKGLLYSLNTIRIEIDSLNRLWLRDAYPFDIIISQKQHYSDSDRTNGLAPPNQWLKLPTYLGRCEKVRVILTTKVIYWQLFTQADLNTMLMHFNSLIYTKLMQHRYLNTIHVELELIGEHHYRSTVTDQEMRSFERGCLDSLCHLRGMRAVHLKGFAFIDPFDVFLAKRTMLLPSSKRRGSCLTLPQMMQIAPQWWQLRNLSKHEPSLYPCTDR